MITLVRLTHMTHPNRPTLNKSRGFSKGHICISLLITIECINVAYLVQMCAVCSNMMSDLRVATAMYWSIMT